MLIWTDGNDNSCSYEDVLTNQKKKMLVWFEIVLRVMITGVLEIILLTMIVTVDRKLSS